MTLHEVLLARIRAARRTWLPWSRAHHAEMAAFMVDCIVNRAEIFIRDPSGTPSGWTRHYPKG